MFVNDTQTMPQTQITLPSQERISQLLEDIENQRSYYAGGSLCVDGVLDGQDVLVMNLDGRAMSFSGSFNMPLNERNLGLLTGIYLKYKGETEYYKEQIKKRK